MSAATDTTACAQCGQPWREPHRGGAPFGDLRGATVLAATTREAL
ncbi:MAG: hypothetical protein WCJ30_06440 [Deltaproteobacteria bacterium]